MNRYPFEKPESAPSVKISTSYLSDDGDQQPLKPRDASDGDKPQQPLEQRGYDARPLSPLVARDEADSDGVPAVVAADRVREGLPDAGPARPVQEQERQAPADLAPLQAEHVSYEPPEVDIDALLDKLPKRKSPTFLSFDRDDTMLSEDLA